MKKGITRRLSMAVLPPMCAWLIRLWFATCRLRIHGEHHFLQAKEGGKPFIASCWHYCLMGTFTFYRKEPFAVMISASTDGEYLSRMAEYLGFAAIRGSRNRKGAFAAKELLKELKKGTSVGLVADGSQGPARIAQPGAILLASKTGNAILPILWSSSRYVAFNSWDRLILPLPFCRLDLFYAEPLLVPKGVEKEEIEKYRQILENSLNKLYDKAWQAQGKTEH